MSAEPSSTAATALDEATSSPPRSAGDYGTEVPPAARPGRRPSGLGRPGHIALAILLSGPVLGAALGAFGFFYDLWTRPSFAVFGKRNERIESIVFGRYGEQLKQDQIDIHVFMVGTGVVLGLVAALLGRLYDATRPAPPPRTTATLLRRGARTFGLALGLHLVVTARGIVAYPQLYAEAMYAHGGLRRGVQVFLTDFVPLGLLDGLLLLLPATALALGGLGWWRARARGATFAAAEVSALAGSVALGLLIGSVTFGQPRPMAAATGASVSALAAGGSSATSARPGPERPNFLIIGIDSLRADRIYPRREDLTPALNALARRGVVFTEAYTSLPRTFPSWVSLLTGRLPQTHGIRNMFPTWEDRRRIPRALPHLLRDAGYRTLVASDYAGDIFSRIDLGFERVWTPTFNFGTLVAQRGLEIHTHALPYANTTLGRRAFPILREFQTAADAERLTDDVIAALRTFGRTEPFFLTVFYSAAHFPYAAPYPFYRRYTDRGYRGEYKYHVPNPIDATDPSPADIRQARALYDGAVAAVDRAVARLLADLGRRGLDKNTVVVVLADHGESLFEPGRGMGHGNHLRGHESLRVPLIVYDPRQKGGRVVRSIVRDIDLVPTLGALAGLPPRALEGVDGTDLGPLMRGERDDLGLAAFAETGLWFVTEGQGFGPGERIPYPNITELTELDTKHHDEVVLKQRWRRLTEVAKHRMLRTAQYKLIYIPTRAGVRYELYDVQSDPDEVKDLAAEKPEVVAELRKQLEAIMRRERGIELVAGFALPTLAPAVR